MYLIPDIDEVYRNFNVPIKVFTKHVFSSLYAKTYDGSL